MTAEPQAPPLVRATIDGVEVAVPKGTLVIRAAEQIGVEIPRFCDHPLLAPVGACRQCLVDVEGQRKPLASCTTTVTEGMVVRTQESSPAAEKAQRGVMELLLINHPLDCPVCDKGGECPLQNQAMSTGRTTSRFEADKRTYPKPINLSAEVLLDRERCVLCARCTRFSKQIAGDPFIELLDRGALQQVGVYGDEPLDSYFSGNTVQICPVGALTGSAYRFRARPFDLVSSPSVCEHCASGCAQRTDHRRGKVLRRLAGDDPRVNEEWNCDKGRWAFAYTRERLRTPLVRTDGELRPASWPEAIVAAATGLAGRRAGVLVGGRVTMEDAYAYVRLARTALGGADVDFRARAHSAEETRFLTGRVRGREDVTYADLETAPAVLLVGFEPEEESPIVFLRLRKAVRTRGLPVTAIAPFADRGLRKLSGTLVPTAPGDEAAALDAAELPAGAIVLVGERLAAAPGALDAAARLADRCGARLAWIPRRAGERGALEAGALVGRDTSQILAAAASGEIEALLVGGVDPGDLPDPAAARAALDAAGFVVSLELSASEVTERADVVLPVAPVAEKEGTFLDWEGRERRFAAAIPTPSSLSDLRVLAALADALGSPLGLADAADARAALAAEPPTPEPGPIVADAAPAAVSPSSGRARLATWHLLIDLGSLQRGEPNLAATARRPIARLSAASAAGIGAVDGDHVTVSTPRGAITLPLVVTEMPDAVVWLPQNSPGSRVGEQLGAGYGDVVDIARADAPDAVTAPADGGAA